IHGSTLTGGHAPVPVIVPLTSRPWRDASTPVTIAVWFGQVTVGLTVVMRRAIAPSAISLRSVGVGSFGSSSAKPGNPSRLITTTLRLGAACPHAAIETTASAPAHAKYGCFLIEGTG